MEFCNGRGVQNIRISNNWDYNVHSFRRHNTATGQTGRNGTRRSASVNKSCISVRGPSTNFPHLSPS